MVYLIVMLGKRLYVVILICLSVKQSLYVWEQHLLLVLHVRTDGMRIFIVQLKNQASKIVILVECLHQFLRMKGNWKSK